MMTGHRHPEGKHRTADSLVHSTAPYCQFILQARAAADIVLTEPGLSTIVDAIIIARRIFRRIAAFLNYRIAATLQLLLFFFIAVFAFAPHRYNPEVHDQR